MPHLCWLQSLIARIAPIGGNDQFATKKCYQHPCFWRDFPINLAIDFWKVSLLSCFKQDYGINLLLIAFQNWLMHLKNTGLKNRSQAEYQSRLSYRDRYKTGNAMPASPIPPSSNVPQRWIIPILGSYLSIPLENRQCKPRNPILWA